MAIPQQQESVHREGRLALALQSYKQGQIKTLKATAILYNVPPITARRRIAMSSAVLLASKNEKPRIEISAKKGRGQRSARIQLKGVFYQE